MNLEEMKAAVAAAEQREAVRFAIIRLDSGVETEAVITSIEATDHASSHRSIEIRFTKEETAAIFMAAKAELEKRLVHLDEVVGG